MAAKVFISYRRADSAGYSGRVMDRLDRELGRDLVFMDVDAIPLGTNFSKVLHEEVAKCSVLLAVIGPNWSDARDEHGNRRLDNPNDFVRIEIAAALQRNIPVIPILLEGARIPKADELPEDLKELALRNGMEVRHASFQDDMNRLIRGLKEDGVYLTDGDASEFPMKTHAAQSDLKRHRWLVGVPA
jgi:TIR domain-containing protein